MNDPNMDMHRIGIDGLNGPGLLQQTDNAKKKAGSAKRLLGLRNSRGEDDNSDAANSLASSTNYPRIPKNTLISKKIGSTRSLGSNDDFCNERLKSEGFSTGLARALSMNAKIFDRRIWVVDNSGSMEIGDGHRIVTTSDREIVSQTVTRWEELKDAVLYHAEMAAILNTPSLFKLLNPSPGLDKKDFAIGGSSGKNSSSDEIREARSFINRITPVGPTPLTQHVWDIQKSIYNMAPKLRLEGRQVVVVLATDGLPTDADGYIGDDIDAEFVAALKALEGLPIWLVIRLCTDEKKVKDFYNELDSEVELSLEVVDDFMGEAEEVYRYNRWLNYCIPMHRCRELGYHNRIFDFLDERPLTRGELREFCSILFGTSVEDIPDPDVSWKSFIEFVQEKLKVEDEQWHPIKKRKAPWISLKHLNKRYGNGNCVIM
mmetsp:Transcript_2681/g.4048  ORF Transcript_2681/g.4048 Transcript_2681/m.4048 type:complete len:431 (+) Transcript_2681:147-1439(+)